MDEIVINKGFAKIKKDLVKWMLIKFLKHFHRIHKIFKIIYCVGNYKRV